MKVLETRFSMFTQQIKTLRRIVFSETTEENLSREMGLLFITVNFSPDLNMTGTGNICGRHATGMRMSCEGVTEPIG